jgi:hypothetical protein
MMGRTGKAVWAAAAFASVLAANAPAALAWGMPTPAGPPQIQEATAIATARRWVLALERKDLREAMALSALPFTAIGRFFPTPATDPSGRARTPAQLHALLGRVARNSYVAGELSAYLQPPSRDLPRRVKVTEGRARVSFEYDPNRLADGTYVDAVVDLVVGPSGLPVVDAVLFYWRSLD